MVQIKADWKQELFMPKKTVHIIGVPTDLGANMRGANIGPSAVRIAGIREHIAVLGFEIHDSGDLDVPVRETLPAEAVAQNYLPQILSTCEELQQRVYDALKLERIPIIFGGDHSIAIGSIAGVSRFYRERREHIGMIWIDAHADLNTPKTSPTGNIHGMPLSVVIGEGHEKLVNLAGFKNKVKPENIALIGIRMLDGVEKENLRRSGIRYFTMREIDERGMAAVMKDAIGVATNGTAALHLSVDLDGVDPLYAPGVSTPVTGGLSYRETHLALEMIADTGLLRSIEIVELNPMTDVAHKTAQLAVDLVQSALGKSIV
jgi:arginase